MNNTIRQCSMKTAAFYAAVKKPFQAKSVRSVWEGSLYIIYVIKGTKPLFVYNCLTKL